jgi:hypothetical protein
MELVVDLVTASVELRHRDAMHRLSVLALPQQSGDNEANGALGALAAALSLHDVGTVGPDGEVLVLADALRKLAADAATEDGQPLEPDWESGFGAMLDSAATNGWIADDGSIRAHVEWAD